MKKLLKFGFYWIWKMKWLSISSWICIILGMITTTSMPFQTGICVDAIKKSIEENIPLDFGPIWLLVFYIVATFILVTTFVILRRAVHFTMWKKIQEGLYKKLLTLGNDFYQKNKTGYLVTVLTTDLEELTWFIYSVFFILVELFIMLGLSFYYIFTIDWMLSIILVMVIGSIIPINIRIIKRSENMFRELRKRVSEVNDSIELCFYGVSVIKAYQREIAQTLKFNRIMKKRADIDYKTTKYRMIIMSFWWVLPSMLAVFVLIYGGFNLIQGLWTVGALSAVIGYLWMINAPMQFFGDVVGRFNIAKACIERINKVFDAKAEIVETEKASKITKPLPFKDNITISDLTFYYDTDKEPNTVFDGIDMMIKKNSKIGILGEVGAGKSTLFQLLLRLLNIENGEITLDGKNIEKLNLLNYRKLFGYVPQEPILFSDTIKKNIVFGRENITDAAIEQAIKISQFDKEIEKFPNKLDELIGPNGLTLSGGQRQRLALARALVHKPQILLLDDTTSALDTKTESDLWHALNKELKNITKIVITHRASTVLDADCIYVFEKGKIKEHGSPDNLLAKESYFRDLYNKQIFDSGVGVG